MELIKNSRTWLGVVCALTLGFTSCNEHETRKPNIVVIFADDMGYGDLSCYGSPNNRTRHIDKMAEEGVRMRSFYAAASLCTPSRASLLTGRSSVRNCPMNFDPQSKGGLPVSEVTFANLLQEQGYHTMAIGKWHLGHQPQYLPTRRGFDHFYGLPYSNDMLLPWCPWLNEEESRLYIYEDETKAKEINRDQDNLTVDYTNRAISFIKKNRSEPFMLYLAHSMPHVPISTTDEFRGKSKGGLYGDVIETIDWSVGQILKTLKDQGLEDNTLVVFTSDNGPWQDLPSRITKNGIRITDVGSTGGLRGCKASTYEGGFRVPAIIRWPEVVQKGVVVDDVTSTLDIYPTVLHLAGISVPKGLTIDGHNIWERLTGEKSDVSKPFFYVKADSLQAVRHGMWKCRITDVDGVQLFNLNDDPAEKFNVAAHYPQQVDRLRILMKYFAKDSGSKTAF
ncbi:sulfatase [Halosquirtibacter xylanolyticus]|uniref:sulfatase family protein n=1 Tax=Halosquirtibacter xylanolyticus TaxID=3374599 RepID=UPI003749C059|nr:sulfatase [Prolixibacteraceae bacterium]